MRVEQISVFLENKSGRLAEVTSVLAEAGINIRVLSVADASDFGVLRMIVNDNKKAEEVLKNSGFAMRKTDVVAVEVEDKPGGLNRILVILRKSEINVEYMYALMRQDEKNAIMIFRFDNIDEAVKLLEENGVNVLDGSKVYTL
jgi:hypothetical protein